MGTVKVLPALVNAGVFPARGLVPFDAEPVAGGGADGADVPDCAEEAGVGEALVEVVLGGHCGEGGYAVV